MGTRQTSDLPTREARYSVECAPQVMRACKNLRCQYRSYRLWCQQPALEYELHNTAAAVVSLECNCSRRLVADVRIEGGYQAYRIFHRQPQSLGISGYAPHTPLFQRDEGGAKMANALEETV